MRLLIVDDDLKNIKLLKAIVDTLGECDIAYSGKKAISTFKKAWEDWRPFDLILLDISMPEMDGKQVLSKIRELEAEKNVSKDYQVRIIMVTAISEKNVVLECLRKGCNDFVTKPIDRQLLFDKIKKLGLLN